jgi:hypothetical protein
MLLITILFIASLSPEASFAGMPKPAGCDLFSRQNASKIIGSEVTWTGNDSPDSEPKKWTCTFVSKKSPDAPKVYFGLHRFSDVDKAREEFDAIVASNKNHAGFERWAGVGDDAIVHTDGSNFQLVMVRKGIRSFRIKVNPARSTSLETLKAVAEDLVRKLDAMKNE